MPRLTPLYDYAVYGLRQLPPRPRLCSLPIIDFEVLNGLPASFGRLCKIYYIATPIADAAHFV